MIVLIPCIVCISSTISQNNVIELVIHVGVPHHEDSPSYFEKSLERSSVGAISHGPNGESKQAQPLKKLFKNVKTKYSGGKPTKATTREM